MANGTPRPRVPPRTRATPRALPPLDKKVIYLDQFVLSEIVKVRAGRTGIPEAEYWSRLANEIERAVCRHVAVFPEGGGHFDESIFSGRFKELEDLYQGFSGEVSLMEVADIRRANLVAFAEAWIKGGGPPALACDVDSILEGKRNRWLGQFSVNVSRNPHPIIVDEITRAKTATAAGVSRGAKTFREGEPFDYVVQQIREADGYGDALRRGVAYILSLHIRAERGEEVDPMLFMNGLWIDCFHAREVFKRSGVSEDESLAKYVEFTHWDGLRHIPWNQISSHLWAAVFRKIAGGQRKDPSPGMANDIDAISVYAPYVDAMFIDRECAGFLQEQPLQRALNYKARIFSMRTKDDFLEYLIALNESTPADQLAEARARFGAGV